MQTTYEEWLEECVPFTGAEPLTRRKYYKKYFPRDNPKVDYDFIAANCDYNAGKPIG